MDKMDNPPTDIVLKPPSPFNYPVGEDLMPHCQIPMERCRNDSCMYLRSRVAPPHAECRNNSYMLIVVMQIYVKDIIETKTNKKLHLPGTGGKQSEDIRQSSFFEKLHQLEGSVQEVFFLHQTSFYTKLFYSG